MSVAYNWDFSVAYNQDVYLIKKSRFWVCMKTRRVSKRDALVLATLRYVWCMIFQLSELMFWQTKLEIFLIIDHRKI